MKESTELIERSIHAYWYSLDAPIAQGTRHWDTTKLDWKQFKR